MGLIIGLRRNCQADSLRTSAKLSREEQSALSATKLDLTKVYQWLGSKKNCLVDAFSHVWNAEKDVMHYFPGYAAYLTNFHSLTLEILSPIVPFPNSGNFPCVSFKALCWRECRLSLFILSFQDMSGVLTCKLCTKPCIPQYHLTS